MYWYDNQRHNVPHFHVRYQGYEAVFDLKGNLLEGRISSRAAGLVAEWCQERSKELQEAWQLAVNGKEVPWITPLP